MDTIDSAKSKDPVVTDGFTSPVFLASFLCPVLCWPQASSVTRGKSLQPFWPEVSHLYNEEIGLENLSSIKVPSDSKIPYVWKCFKRSQLQLSEVAPPQTTVCQDEFWLQVILLCDYCSADGDGEGANLKPDESPSKVNSKQPKQPFVIKETRVSQSPAPAPKAPSFVPEGVMSPLLSAEPSSLDAQNWLPWPEADTCSWTSPPAGCRNPQQLSLMRSKTSWWLRFLCKRKKIRGMKGALKTRIGSQGLAPKERQDNLRRWQRATLFSKSQCSSEMQSCTHNWGFFLTIFIWGSIKKYNS